MRIDQLLVERGLASSRSQAQRLVASGVRWQGPNGWRTAAKNGDEVPADAAIELLDAAEARYVSRGGLKLEGALRTARVDVTGRVCLDVGQSTGGFTDCLLHHGAAHVVGVDVGHAQLHARLRGDPRVTCVEGVNARDPDALKVIADFDHLMGTDGQFNSKFDLITGDVSFISSTLVLPAVVPHLKPGGTLLWLVKPQFELQPHQIGKGGIVKDAALYTEVAQRLHSCCAGLGLQVQQWFDSPITGGDGNREFFMDATHGNGSPA
ncbi:MAG: TlyA family RNA methyltransferase [Burkholderiales bacterium]|nr:TlyA family RNA methyltransferase [Burkholderiales bacterium]